MIFEVLPYTTTSIINRYHKSLADKMQINRVTPAIISNTIIDKYKKTGFDIAHFYTYHRARFYRLIFLGYDGMYRVEERSMLEKKYCCKYSQNHTKVFIPSYDLILQTIKFHPLSDNKLFMLEKIKSSLEFYLEKLRRSYFTLRLWCEELKIYHFDCLNVNTIKQRLFDNIGNHP